jgi:hypothetical protein
MGSDAAEKQRTIRISGTRLRAGERKGVELGSVPKNDKKKAMPIAKEAGSNEGTKKQMRVLTDTCGLRGTGIGGQLTRHLTSFRSSSLVNPLLFSAVNRANKQK